MYERLVVTFDVLALLWHVILKGTYRVELFQSH